MTTAPPATRREPQAGGFGPARMMMGPPVTKSMDFRGSTRRLLRTLRPQRALLLAALALGICSVTLSVLGPLILGRATDLIFAGSAPESCRLPCSSFVSRWRRNSPGCR